MFKFSLMCLLWFNSSLATHPSNSVAEVLEHGTEVSLSRVYRKKATNSYFSRCVGIVFLHNFLADKKDHVIWDYNIALF